MHQIDEFKVKYTFILISGIGYYPRRYDMDHDVIVIPEHMQDIIFMTLKNDRFGKRGRINPLRSLLDAEGTCVPNGIDAGRRGRCNCSGDGIPRGRISLRRDRGGYRGCVSQ